MNKDRIECQFVFRFLEGKLSSIMQAVNSTQSPTSCDGTILFDY
jgi:hypothetical protein